MTCLIILVYLAWLYYWTILLNLFDYFNVYLDETVDTDDTLAFTFHVTQQDFNYIYTQMHTYAWNICMY